MDFNSAIRREGSRTVTSLSEVLLGDRIPTAWDIPNAFYKDLRPDPHVSSWPSS